MPIDGSIALVTGGAVRLGKALALGLARRGASVCVHYGSSGEEAERTVAEIRELGAAAHLLQADFRDPAAVAPDLLAAVVERFGRVDTLINSAAIFESASLAETSEEHFDRHVAVNLKAPLFLSREFAAQGGSNIVNIVDWRGTRPPPGHLSYTLTKSALIAMTRLLAQELAPAIRVNGVAPGAILPPPGAPDAYLDRLREGIPLRRTGSPEDIVEAAAYLLEAEFVTGEILHINGGEHL